MRLQPIIISAIASLLLATLLAGPVMAQNKFENKDTAVDRQDHRWGTRQVDENTGGYHGKTERGDDSWGNKVGPQEEQRSPYDDVIITVSPEVKYGNQTATTTTKDAAGNVTGSTTTTTEN